MHADEGGGRRDCRRRVRCLRPRSRDEPDEYRRGDAVYEQCQGAAPRLLRARCAAVLVARTAEKLADTERAAGGSPFQQAPPSSGPGGCRGRRGQAGQAVRGAAVAARTGAPPLLAALVANGAYPAVDRPAGARSGPYLYGAVLLTAVRPAGVSNHPPSW